MLSMHKTLPNDLPPEAKKRCRSSASPSDVAYGPTDIEKVDIYKTKRPDAPTMIFIHGGAWRGGRSADFAVYAEVFVKAGSNFVVVDFNNVLETQGDLFPMVDQCRRAVAWVYRNAASFGADPHQTYLCSRSSGSHLAGCVVTTDWEQQGLPRDIIKGAVLGSGMYDLKPVRLPNAATTLSSPMTWNRRCRPAAYREDPRSVVLAIGTLETPEFQRQTRDFAAALIAAGKPVQVIVGKGYNHFERGETLGNPYAVMGRAALEHDEADNT